MAVGGDNSSTFAEMDWGYDPSFATELLTSTNTGIDGDLDSASFNSPFLFNASGIPPTGSAPAFAVYGIVPEPSTYTLLIGSACLGLVIWQRKRRLMTS